MSQTMEEKSTASVNETMKEESTANSSISKAMKEKTTANSSISEAMLGGLWGKFKSIINTTLRQWQGLSEKKDTKNPFTLPDIVAIGQEASGKSSVLESITKCAIFPRDRKQCTSRPVRVRLQPSERFSITVGSNAPVESPEETRELIAGSMSTDDTINEIELLVTLYSPDVPELELVDLPGIREYPPEKRETTKKIVQSYIGQTDSIVLCVVPSTSPRVTGDQAIGMIKHAGKQGSTVVALTMIDKVEEDDIDNQIVQRVLQKNDEDLGCFAAYVGVANRKHTNRISLEEAHKHDQEIVKKIHTIAKESEITGKIGVDSLITTVMSLFDDVMRSTWKALHEFQSKRDELVKEMNKLGEDPENINPDDLKKAVCQQLVMNAPLDKIWKHLAENHEKDTSLIVSFSPDRSGKRFVGGHLTTDAYSRYAVATDDVIMKEKAMKLIHDLASLPEPQNMPQAGCKGEFIDLVQNKERFDAFLTKCSQTARKQLQDMDRDEKVPCITGNTSSLIGFIRHMHLASGNPKKQQIQENIQVLFTMLFQDMGRGYIFKEMQVEPQDMREREDYASKRRQLKAELENLDSAKNMIESSV